MGTRNANLAALSAAGVSVWLDDLSRDRIESGNLAELTSTRSIVGVTTNPAIFKAAITGGASYDAAIPALAAEGLSADAAVMRLTTEDVRAACDVLAPIAAATEGVDGVVSIEVDPRYAEDPTATVAQARELWDTVGRDNLLIKIPATRACLPAITEVVAAGISVNVTLIFSTERYREVADAYLEGLEGARAAGRDLSRIHSVASFFVSRVDTEIDARLDAIGTDAALALRGAAGLANARLAFAAYEEIFTSERFAALAAAGARPQRPLWASTGTKNPEYPDTLYVTELVAPGTVNTLPEATLEATADHGEIRGDTISGTAGASADVFAALAGVGVDTADVFAVLEREGVEKFVDAWNELLGAMGTRLEA